MTIAKLPLNENPYLNVDEVSLSKNSAAVYNSYVDEGGTAHRRPGLYEISDFNVAGGVDGLYWWESRQYALAVSGGRVFKIHDATGTWTELTGATLKKDKRASFTDAGLKGQYCFIANGGPLVYTTGIDLTQLADTDAPQDATHLAFHDQYILANSPLTGYFHWCDVNAPETWSALSFASAEAKPDNLIALACRWREIALVGRQTFEIWYNDGSSPFSRLEGAYTERGISAPYTLQFCNNTWWMLDHERHLCEIEGRNPKLIIPALDKLIADFGTVSDALSDVINFNGRSVYVLSFPTENRSFVIDIAKKELIGEWTWWNADSATHERWAGNCSCYCPGWGATLVGDRRQSKVYKLSTAYTNDDGDTIRMVRRSAPISHGTGSKKRSALVRFRMKRGAGVTGSVSSAAELSVRYRDDGKAVWGNERIVSLGALGETEYFGTLRQMGMYRTRQYELVFTDEADMAIADVEEDVEVLPR